ncbi:hypothetical protein SHI21_06450 [Bacteriovorax sp. PP10]|uniref:Uncharacterized protein n=1 Tax=Bacteriovorax antarcticus TaxID=3088717 RepID=A0ABU5VW28_9BACT|nr:hypothetical protein [Bacteriovorax sp. PP10]MEA9355830.1 hypothetical protein [Bacteriovorax sp. PP10]
MIHKKTIYLFSTLLYVLAFARNSYALNGSYKTYFSESKTPYEDSYAGELTSTFRPKYTWSPNENYTFYAAYALSVDWQKRSPLLLAGPKAKQGYRVLDLDQELYSSDKDNQKSSRVLLNQNLDRFYVSYSKNAFNLNVGRAPIAFGSSKIINPTDVLTPISYQTLDKEERVGIDTIRVNYSLGALSLLDIGYVLGHKLDFSESAVFTRLKTNVWATDVSIMLMDFQENLMTGVDFSRSIGNASAWLESAYVVPKFFNQDEKNNFKSYLRTTIGFDYKLTESIYSYIEYHYNGAGASDPKRYMFLQSQPAYQEGGVYLQGAHYVAPGMTYELSSLWKLTGQFLLNLSDHSIFNNLALEYNVAQDAFIDLGAYVPAGKKSQYIQRSEFGSYPTSIYTSLRFYF